MLDAVRRIQLALGEYVWLEGEVFFDGNFSEVAFTSACSGERALALDAAFAPPTSGYFASYRTRVDEGAYDVWIAMQVDEDVRSHVEVLIGSATFKLPDEPQSGYGPGFAWYKLATLPLTEGIHTVTIRIPATSPEYRAQIDMVLLMPGPFRPSGPRMPPIGR